MRISYEWLKEFIDFDLGYEELINTLTMIGLESEKGEKMLCEFDGVIVGKIVELSKKEQGKIATVDVGQKEFLKVYCTAPNVETGMLAPYAPPDSVIKGVRVESKQFGNFISSGVLCSASELGIGRDSTGVLPLCAPLKVGDNLEDYLFGDLPIEIDVVTNRGDLHSFIGIARELAVHLKRKINEMPELIPQDIIEKAHGDMGIDLRDPDLCPLYTYRMIEDAAIHDSPAPILRKLISLGLKPINNIVDITNIVLYELGQPLHPFDRANLRGNTVIIRRAFKNEHFSTLDDVDRELSENDLLIADSHGGIALGGVMGGLLSEINWNTKNVLLESALFNKINIRRTSRRHALRTDASMRFERGVNPATIISASSRVMWYVDKLKIGKPSKALVYAGQIEYPKRKITVRLPRIESCLGFSIPTDELKRILVALGFNITDCPNDTLNLEVPEFRADIEIEEDIAEELARHYGYNSIPSALPKIIMGHEHLKPYDRLKYSVRELLAGWGLYEVVTLALGNKKDLGRTHFLRAGAKRIDLVNPLTEEHTCLRTNLEESMLDIIANNSKKHSGLRDIFEIGRGYWRENDKFMEKDELCMILSHDQSIKGLDNPEEDLFLRLKGLVLELLGFLKITDYRLENPVDYDFNEIRGDAFVWISTNGNKWGYIRLIPEHEIEKKDVSLVIASAALDWETILKLHLEGRKAIELEALPRYPSSKRDLALVVPQGITYEQVEKAIRKSAGELLVDLRLFDIYRGKQIEKGYLSMAFNLTFQDPERTLTDEIVDDRIKAILTALKELGVLLRDK